MKRREFLSGVAAGLVAVTSASAQDFVSGIIDQLRRQGFRSIVQERTLLGRVRITATRKDGQREIIVNPRTGELLRDLWMPVDGGEATVEIIDDKSDDDDDRSDDNDDRDDDDSDDDSRDSDGGDDRGDDDGGDQDDDDGDDDDDGGDDGGGSDDSGGDDDD